MSPNASNKGQYVDSALFLSPPDDWVKVVKVMKPGAHLLLLCETKDHHTGAIAAEDAGLEIRDTLAYVFANSENGGSKVEMQLIAMARKPLQGTVAKNVLEWGTGGINIDRCRINLQPEEDVEKLNKRSGGIRGFGSASVYGDGTTGPGTDLSKGRWPANLLHCGSPAVKGMFPNCKPSPSPNRPIVRGKRTALVYGGQTNAEGTMGYGYGDGGSAARFFFSTVPCTSYQDRTLDLCQYLLKLITPPRGTVLTSPQDFGLVEKAVKGEGFTVLEQDD